MAAGERRRFTVRDKQGAQWIGALVATLEPGWVVTVSPPGRSSGQNRLFHQLCDEVAKARPIWNGIDMTGEDYKSLFIVSHAIATSGGTVRLVPDLEGRGLVQLRERSSRMSKERASSLIEYVHAWAAQNGVQFMADARETA